MLKHYVGYSAVLSYNESFAYDGYNAKMLVAEA